MTTPRFINRTVPFFFAALLTLGFFAPSASSAAEGTPAMADRWFYASFGVGDDAQAEELTALIQKASDAGLNGMLWACGVESYGHWDEARKARLAKVKEAADAAGIEIIPILWSIGYSTMLGENPNLAEGILIRGLPMTAKDGRTEFAPEAFDFGNGGMESWKGDRLTDYAFHDAPGVRSFRDGEIRHSGESSLRFENLASSEHGHGRLMKEITLAPNRLYRTSVWMRVENAGGNIMLQVHRKGGGEIGNARLAFKPGESTDWKKYSVVFRTPDDGAVCLYAGIWEGTKEKIWLDDFSVEPLGLVNPIRRDGTPITVTDSAGKSFDEGKDWKLPAFKLQPWNSSAEPLRLIIPEGSRIADGESIFVDYYYPPLVGAPQIGTCMSDPELYRLFEESAKNVVKALAPKKWFLSMDEIRCAGTCRACHERNISLAAILGDCITKQYEIIQRATPGADVYIWSDMLDPNHNAHGNYFVCDGDYTGVWEMVPKELIVSCWYHKIREKSMKFFSDLGFRTQAAAYYDAETLDGCADWLETCRETPRCTGIMYTTWRHRYALLEEFGKMLKQNDLSSKTEEQ